MVKDKLILRKIAKRWCQAILMANEITDEEIFELISEDEAEYIVAEAEKIALRIYSGNIATSLKDIIQEEFDFENEI
jgi:hypothetical protein